MPPRNARSSQPFQDAGSSPLRSLLNVPLVRAILVLNGLLFLCLAYGRINFYRDPGSIFFDESHAYERRYSALREAQAIQWLAKAKQLYPEHHSRGPRRTPAVNATICAAFLTTPREGVEPYLDNAIASFLDRMTPQERSQIHLSVFFATSEPFSHTTYHRTWLRKVVDEVYSYADVLHVAEMEDVRALEKAASGLRKSPYDYTIPIRQCYENSKARYIAIFEDDIILAEGWLARTLLSLREMETTMRKQRRRGEWLYMRLFNQERSTGWVSNRIGGNHEMKYWAYFAIPIALFLLVIRRRSRRWRYLMDNQVILIVTCVFTPIFVILYFKAGKASMKSPQPGVREEDFGCCAQGLILNRFHAEHLADYMLIRQKDGYHDNLLTDYAHVFELARWSQYPMMIQHVGKKSSIQEDPLEAQRVWSMAFEDLNPKTLTAEHKLHVDMLFGNNSNGALDILRPTYKDGKKKTDWEVELEEQAKYEAANREAAEEEAAEAARQAAEEIEFEVYEMEREI